MTGYPVRNRIVLALKPAAQDFIAARSLTRPVIAGEVIYEDGAPFTHAVFPHAGLISLMATMANSKTVEKTSVGHEGFLGFGLIMGGSGAFGRCVVQVPGYASWLSKADLDQALAEFQCVRETMLSYAKSLITQLMETVACNSLHSAEQRVIRWLLIAHDSVLGDNFDLTQQIVAEVLGLRRATVSAICSQLQSDGLLEYSRGVVTIVDRAGVEARACECLHNIQKASMRHHSPAR
ncbi:putative Transcriptional regulator, Crp/Fnr family [Rhizobium mesoamericanum STM3625]|uniref:Putative Transcriptional regulator, Crp/Fnr family n=1 Tax=Rhizobium mesoamericanum STM3625 TaxID=1211777 RepID=K0PSE3_9HYPH|nr:putative Transcriptional regulator, Crp/Fnr family [Rhizobium mesoamericanum STM3625]